jgi:excisionase family DNA binding protein
MMAMDDPQVYRIEEAARILGVSRSQAYEAAKRGEIRTFKIGKRILVPKQVVADILAGKAL